MLDTMKGSYPKMTSGIAGDLLNQIQTSIRQKVEYLLFSFKSNNILPYVISEINLYAFHLIRKIFLLLILPFLTGTLFKLKTTF